MAVLYTLMSEIEHHRCIKHGVWSSSKFGSKIENLGPHASAGSQKERTETRREYLWVKFVYLFRYWTLDLYLDVLFKSEKK